MIHFKNPEFLRLARSKLRPRALFTYGLIAVLIFGGVLASAYFIEKSNSQRMTRWGPVASKVSITRAFHSAFVAIMGFQLAIVALFGVALSAQNVTLEKERGTFDFQRLVSMGPWRLTVGKLMGAPIEAFYMAGIGTLFALIACLGCDIALIDFLQSQIVVFGFGLTVCSLALMCSSLANKTAQATGLAMAFGIPIYILCVNINFASFWSSANPLLLMKQIALQGRAGTSATSTIHFCGIALPVIVGFVTISVLAIWLNLTITSRRIADAELSFMTPRQGFFAFAILQCLLMGDLSAYSGWHGLLPIKIFHGVNLAALLFLAFALTPGAELVRGRVLREPRDGHWKVVFEHTNRLQDAPGIRALLDVCLIYLFATIIHAFVLAGGMPLYPEMLKSEALMFVMNSALGIAAAAMLLYVQVYTERAAFKIGMFLVLTGFIIPPFLMWIAYEMEVIRDEIYIMRISPVAYITGQEELTFKGGMFVCPAIAVVLAVAFCLLAAMRIRFVIDMEDVARQRAERELAGAA